MSLAIADWSDVELAVSDYGSSGSPADTMVRPGADSLSTGWYASSGFDLAAMLDETSADDADYIHRSLTGTEPYVFDLYINGSPYALPVGSHTIRMRPSVETGTAQMRLLLLDAIDATVGTGDWVDVTDTWTTAEFTITTTAEATKGRIEAQA